MWYDSPMEITRQEFDQYVEQAIESVEPQFRRYLDEVPVIVEDEPSAELCREMDLPDTHSLLGLFQGIPFHLRSVQAPDGPNQIVLYRRNLIASCRTRRKLAEQIRRTLVHELAHLVGFSEEQIRRLRY